MPGFIRFKPGLTHWAGQNQFNPGKMPTLFYIQQRHDPELTACQRELKFNALPVTPPRYVTRLYVCRKNLCQVYESDNSIVWDRFALPNTTRDSDQCWLRIYEWIPYRHCRMSVQYCACVRFPLFHNVHICICSVWQESAVAQWLRWWTFTQWACVLFPLIAMSHWWWQQEGHLAKIVPVCQ